MFDLASSMETAIQTAVEAARANGVASSMETAIQTAVKAARASGEILSNYYRDGVYKTSLKDDTSLQTTADLVSEQVIIDIIKRDFPTHSIDTEERGFLSSGPSSYKWIVDSLDGTENFFLGIPYFSTSITLCEKDVPKLAVVYNPILDHLYTAVKDKGAWLNGKSIHVSDVTNLKSCRVFFIPDFITKRKQDVIRFRDGLYMRCRRVLDTWSPALDWCLVASGKVDIVVNMGGYTMRRDAGTLILEEAGGRITNFYNEPFDSSNDGRVLGSNNTLLHDQIVQLAQEYCL